MVKLATARQALGCSEARLRKLIRDGHLPVYGSGGQRVSRHAVGAHTPLRGLRLRESDLKAYVEATRAL